MIAIDGAHLPRPGFGDAQVALTFTGEHIAVSIDDFRDYPEERLGRRTGLEFDRTRQWRDQNAAGLGLPPGVNDWAAAIADHSVVPLPCFGLVRLPAAPGRRKVFCGVLFTRP